jgi:N utilization substance protein B
MPRKQTPLAADDRPPPRKPSARSSAKARRTAARLTAVQILYQAAINGQPLSEALEEFADYRIGQIIDDIEIVPADRETLDAVIGGLIQYGPRIEELLTNSLRGSPPERLELLLRCIIRAGLAELLVRRDLPAGLIISDYLSVTDAFYAGSEIKLVNAVLDGGSKAIRQNATEILSDL